MSLQEVLDMFLDDDRRRNIFLGDRSGHRFDTHAIEYLPLIRFILDSGANPNAYYLANNNLKPSFRWRGKKGGTLLDMFAKHLICEDLHFRIQSKTQSMIYKQLVDDGGEFSMPLTSIDGIHPHYWFGYFSTEMEEFQTFPEQLEGTSE